MSKIIGVTVGTPISPSKIDRELKPVKSVNGIMPDEKGNVVIESVPRVTDYGAKGDGSTDDTAAFQTALAENRVVFVPGGTYKLSGELVIGHHCELELSPDTVLNFTQTTGNCISVGMMGRLKANLAVINVPYEFTGIVVNADTADTEESEIYEVEPWKKWDPMWKYGRYVSDLNICKKDSRGFHYSVNGECNGTAVHIAANASHMWGLHYSGLRIAGAFDYGIHGVCTNDGWLHEMRVDAFIDGCEIGVCLENCNNTYISAVVQPRRAYTMDEKYIPYAKQGIRLVNCVNTDLSGARVWDWDAEKTLCANSIENQHIAMYGDCRGTILNDFLCYHSSADFKDVRDAIYTDTPSNLEKMTILQEPLTRWFKPRENKPYFFDGNAEKQLLLQEEFNECFKTDYVPQFTDALATAINTDGSVFNEIGYDKFAGSMGSDGFTYADGSVGYYGHTGFIPCKAGDTLYFKNFDFKLLASLKDGWCRAHLYDANFNHIGQNSTYAIIDGSQPYVFSGGTVTDDGGTLVVSADKTNAAYARFSFRDEMFGTDPIISVNNPIVYAQEGFLADGIKVKAENVVGNTGGGSGGATPDWNASEGEPGHVLNRTHYDGMGYALLYAANKTAKSGRETRLQPEFEFVVGQKYKVVVFDSVYEQVAYTGSNGFVSFGAPYNSDYSGYDYSVYPFALYKNSSSGRIFFATDFVGDFHIEVYVEVETAYKLDRKYLHASNWNANEEDNGHIKNRTHYTEVTSEIVLLDGIDYFTSVKDGGYSPDLDEQVENELVIGKTYKVVWDDAEYICVCAEDEVATGFPFVGAFYDEDEEVYSFVEFPFLAYSNSNKLEILSKTAGIHTYRISEVETVVHRLDEKYMPLLTSPNGTKYLLSVADDGTITAVPTT